MRTLIDAICPGCGDVHVDVWMDTVQPSLPPCRRCGAALGRHWAYARAAQVRPDSIPGGYWVEHGLCHADGSARRYDSHSEMAREATRRGLRQSVEHVPERGSDKNPLTTRWV